MNRVILLLCYKQVFGKTFKRVGIVEKNEKTVI